ncbi:hypothetical protein [Bacillus sp. RCC_6_1]|uniref:hypothetical protein n=1 Tax=Bacillus sp. RCC_6_1 TaxID=3239229 RepID=UPI003525A98C
MAINQRFESYLSASQPYMYPEFYYDMDINERPTSQICYKWVNIAGHKVKVPTPCNPGTNPGKKGYERKLGELNWKEPYTYECWYYVGPIKTKGFCPGMANKGIEYFYGLTYPNNVNTMEELLILNCASQAGAAGWSVLAPAVGSGNPAAVVVVLPRANEVTQETMRKCIQATPLAPEIKNNITIGITHRRK